MAEKKETKENNQKEANSWGLIDKHPFIIGISILFITDIVLNFLLKINLGIISVALEITGFICIIRGIYLAIKKRKKD